MREILFRGKRKDNGEWIEGDSLIHSMYKKGDVCIGVVEGLAIHSVIPSTIGQFTGLTDKNGKKIFEGDIVKYSNGYGHIAWAELHGAFMCVEENGEYWEWFSNMYDIEVIGNIHDNPELLESEVEGE
jgi:uncharacterized phage protein (TIGR01671 family)